MKSKTITMLVIVTIVAALGALGIITSAISSATDVHATSCKNEPGPPCHGCSSFSRGAFASHFRCRHLA